MSKNVSKEILKVIKESLPETQVSLIKDALNERDDLLRQVEELNATITRKDESLDKIFEDNKKSNARNSDLSDINSKITNENNELKVRNQELEKKEIERRADIAEGKLAVVQQTQELFLKNTIVRETLQHQVVEEHPNMISQYTPTGVVSSQQGVNKTYKPVTDTKTETKE